MRVVLPVAVVLAVGAFAPHASWGHRDDARRAVLSAETRAAMREVLARSGAGLGRGQHTRAGTLQATQSRLDTTLAFSRTGTVDLTQLSGDVVVTAWDRAEVQVRAYVERGQLRRRFSPSHVAVDVEPVRGRTGESRIDVSVPAGVRVTVRSRSGDVSVRGTGAAVEVRSTSGDVTVSDAADRVVLETLSGDVRGARLGGAVRAESTNGSIELREVSGDVEAETTSGDVVLTGVRSRLARITTVGGDIEYEGALDAAGRYDFRSHSGDIRLEIPEGSGARFSVETFSGALDSEFQLTLEPGTRSTAKPRRFEFTLGAGGARATAASFSGDIVITRRLGSAR